jgi:hypothetical protein
MAQKTDPTLILESIRNDVALIGEDLKVIANQVIDEGISEYPLFIASQELLDLGRPIFDPETAGLNWIFRATILEDFVNRNIISQSKVADFQRTMGDPRKNACIVVITPEGIQLVFVPFDIK